MDDTGTKRKLFRLCLQLMIIDVKLMNCLQLPNQLPAVDVKIRVGIEGTKNHEY